MRHFFTLIANSKTTFLKNNVFVEIFSVLTSNKWGFAQKSFNQQ